MARELELNCSLVYSDAEGTEFNETVEDLFVNVSTKRPIRYKSSIPTSEAALITGASFTLGYCLIINRDETNFIELRVGTGGADFAKLKPGEFAFFRAGSDAQSPYAIANTSACQVDIYLIPD